MTYLDTKLNVAVRIAISMNTVIATIAFIYLLIAAQIVIADIVDGEDNGDNERRCVGEIHAYFVNVNNYKLKRKRSSVKYSLTNINKQTD